MAAQFSIHETSYRSIRVINQSQKDKYYTQCFDRVGQATAAAALVNKAELQGDEINETVLVCGTAAHEFRTLDALDHRTLLLPRYTGKVGWTMYTQGLFVPAADFEPLYVQDFKPTQP
jgi:tRNA A37 threonylcarbamoyladenosine modification protein TsaB